MARMRQRIQELEQEERRLKDVKEKEGRIDFFPTWKPAQGVKNNAEEEEQYMTIGEDGRPYIAVRRKTEEEKEKVQEEVIHAVFSQREEEDWIEEEEQYLTIGADGRPYIAVRSIRINKLEEQEQSKEVRPEARKKEEVTAMKEEDEESERLVREYQRNAIPDKSDLRLMELYGGAEWRMNEGADLRRCIRRILERCELEEIVGENWRKEQGLTGRNYIGMIAKRERMKKRESLPAEDKDIKNKETKGERGEQESRDPKKKGES